MTPKPNLPHMNHSSTVESTNPAQLQTNSIAMFTKNVLIRLPHELDKEDFGDSEPIVPDYERYVDEYQLKLQIFNVFQSVTQDVIENNVELSCISRAHVKNTHGVLLCFDTHQRKHLQMLPSLIKDCKAIASNTCSFLLVGVDRTKFKRQQMQMELKFIQQQQRDPGAIVEKCTPSSIKNNRSCLNSEIGPDLI